ncbi:hypothetical protein GF324_05035 [bacterium]|nr:hypothetical protein [bacterium]
MLPESRIDVTTDPMTFKHQVMHVHGDAIRSMTSVYYARAVHEAENFMLHAAVADAEFAFQLAQLYDAYSHIHVAALLVKLHLERGDFDNARFYYEWGRKYLDPGDRRYKHDRDAFKELQKRIEDNGGGNTDESMQ